MHSNLCNITVINTNNSGTFHITGVLYENIIDENNDIDEEKIMELFKEEFPNYHFKITECSWGITNNLFIKLLNTQNKFYNNG